MMSNPTDSLVLSSPSSPSSSFQHYADEEYGTNPGIVSNMDEHRTPGKRKGTRQKHVSRDAGTPPKPALVHKFATSPHLVRGYYREVHQREDSASSSSLAISINDELYEPPVSSTAKVERALIEQLKLKLQIATLERQRSDSKLEQQKEKLAQFQRKHKEFLQELSQQIEQQKEQFSSQMANKQKHIDSLSVQVASLREKNTHLEGMNQKIEASLEDHREAYRALDQEHHNLNAQLSTMQQENAQLRETIDEARMSNENLGEQINDLLQDKSVLKSTVTELNTSLSALQESYRALSESHEGTADHRNDLLKELEQEREANNGLTADFHTLQKNSQVQQQELNEKLSELTQHFKSLNEEHEETQNHLQKTQNSLTQSQEENINLASQIAHLKEEIEMLNHQLLQLTSQKEKTFEELHSTSSVLDQVKANFNSTKSELLELRQVSQERSQKIDSLEKQVQELNNDVQTLEQVNADLKSNMLHIRDTLSSTHDLLKQSQNELHHTIGERDALQKSLSESKTLLFETNAKGDEKINQQQHQLTVLSKELQEITQNRDAMQRRFEETQDALHSTREILNSTQEALSIAQQEVSSLNKQTTQLSGEIGDITTVRNSLLQSVREYETKQQELQQEVARLQGVIEKEIAHGQSREAQNASLTAKVTHLSDQLQDTQQLLNEHMTQLNDSHKKILTQDSAIISNDEEIKRLTTQNQMFAARLQQLNAQLEDLNGEQSTNRSLEESIAQLDHNLKIKENLETSLRSTISSMGHTIANLNERVARQLDEIDSLTQQNMERSTALAETERRLEDSDRRLILAEKKIRSLSNELESAIRSINNKEKQLADLEREFNSSIQKHQQQIDSYSTAHEDQHTKITTLQRTIATLQEKTTELSTQLQQQYSAFQQQRTDMQDEISSLLSKLDELQKEKKNTNFSKDVSERKLANLQEDLRAARELLVKEAHTHSETKQKMQQRINELMNSQQDTQQRSDQAMSKKTAQIAELETRFSEVETEKRHLIQEVEELSTLLKSERAERNTLIEQVSDLRQKHELHIDDIQCALSTRERDVATLKRQLDQQESLTQQIQSQYDSELERRKNIEKEFQEFRPKHQHKMAKLEETLEFLRSESKIFQDSLAACTHKLEKAETALKEEKDKTTQMIQSADTKYSKLLESLKAAVSSKEALEVEHDNVEKMLEAQIDENNTQRDRHLKEVNKLKAALSDNEITLRASYEQRIALLTHQVQGAEAQNKSLQNMLLKKSESLQEAQVLIDRGKIELHDSFTFEKNSSTLQKSDANMRILDELADIVKRNAIRIRVEGHTGKGNKALSFYRDLSSQRAQSICRELKLRGIPESKLESKGWGYLKPPIDETQDPKRVEIFVCKPGDREKLILEEENIQLRNMVVSLNSHLRTLASSSSSIGSPNKMSPPKTQGSPTRNAPHLSSLTQLLLAQSHRLSSPTSPKSSSPRGLRRE